MRLVRLWLLWIVLLALLLAALLGGPLGLWGGGGSDQSGEHRPGDTKPGDTKPGDTKPGDTKPGDTKAGDVDRALGRMTAVDEALAEGQLGRTFDLLQAGERIGVPASLQRRWSEARRQADIALAQCLQQLVQEVRSGQILAARSRLAQLTEGANPRVAERLARMGRDQGWPPSPDPVRGAQPDGEVVAAAKELTRHRRVRVAHRGSVIDVPVWQSNDQNVTVRLQDESGVAFPVYHRAAVEPVDPTFDEALEQARICHCAGDALCAWLWLCHCLGRPGATQHAKELAALRQLLR